MKKVHLLICSLFFFSCNCDSGKTEVTTTEKPVENTEVSTPAEQPRTYTMKSKPEAPTTPAADRVTKPEQKPAPAQKPTTRPAPAGKANSAAIQKMADDARAKGMAEEDIQAKIIAPQETITIPVVVDKLPATCQFLSEAFLGRYFKTDASAIKVKDASSPKTKYVRSCFFKWDNGVIANSGIFLQIQENPFPDEIPNYATSFISSKKEKGEQMMAEEIIKYEYKDFDAGDEGCYSDEQGKFYWRVGDEYVFMLALNLGMDKKSERRYGTDLIREIMKNYKKVAK